jgi:hypothetical protein
MEMETKEPTAQPLPRRRKTLKFILVILLLLFIVIQFFQPDKNNKDVTSGNDISAMVPVPDTVQQLLKVACYDCHSNNTNYPWYSNIQPVGWWLNHHIEEGKENLNFNEFVNIPPRGNRTTRERQLKKLEEIKETIDEGEMPLTSYTLIHKEAKLSAAQKAEIIKWSESAYQTIAATGKK